MEVFNYDFISLFTMEILLVMIIGTFIGMIFGAIPGLGGHVAIILLLPFTFSLSPLASILLLLSTYQASEYGGSISSITLGIPGTGSAVATLEDGRPLAKNNPGKALGYSLTASFVGGVFGGLVLLFFTAPIAEFALQLSAPEFFLIGVLGLLAVAGLSSKDSTKSFISVILGLMVGSIGSDMFTGTPRFTLGYPQLMDGIYVVILIIGLFALTEMFDMLSPKMNQTYKVESRKLKTNLSRAEVKKVTKPTIIGSITGTLMGIIPGLGAGVSSWIAYTTSKKFSKSKESFGKGNPEGIAAPESANNATVGGALIPLLSLGIPGSPAIAIIMGAFIIHGIQPGPSVISTNSELVYGIFYGFLVSTIIMFIIGKGVTRVFSRILNIPNSLLIPIVLVVSLIGAYAAQESYFDLWIVVILGIAGFLLKKLEYSIPSFLLAFILAPIIEESFRRALLLSGGSYTIFLTRPYSLVLIILIVSIIIVMSILRCKQKSKEDSKESVA